MTETSNLHEKSKKDSNDSYSLFKNKKDWRYSPILTEKWVLLQRNPIFWSKQEFLSERKLIALTIRYNCFEYWLISVNPSNSIREIPREEFKKMNTNIKLTRAARWWNLLCGQPLQVSMAMVVYWHNLFDEKIIVMVFKGCPLRVSIYFYQKTKRHWFLLWLKKKLQYGTLRKRKDGMSEYCIVGTQPVKTILNLIYDKLRIKHKLCKLILSIIEDLKKVQTSKDFLKVATQGLPAW